MNRVTSRNNPHCKFCEEPVKRGGDCVIYRDGSCAHEDCHDNEEYLRENMIELMEREQEGFQP